MDKKKFDRYEIPRGSWFEWVSIAHYFAEIVSSISSFSINLFQSIDIYEWLLYFLLIIPNLLLNGYI